MEPVPEEAPLAPEGPMGSTEALLQRPAPTGSSNSRALKVAGITTLVCLLLSAQAFTAYMVFSQSRQIQGLQANNMELQARMDQRSRVPPRRVEMPVGNLPLTFFIDDDDKIPDPPTPTPKPKEAQPTKPSVEEELRVFMEDLELPRFNQTFLANLQTMKQQIDEPSWKSFESWLRSWLIFQMAQKTPTPLPASPASRTKCQLEAEKAGLRRAGLRRPAIMGTGLMGTFSPQCDEAGGYRPVQCWPAIGRCWCVDEAGVQVGGTHRVRPDCDLVLA